MTAADPKPGPADWLAGHRVKLYFDSTRRVWSLVDPQSRTVVAKATSVILRDCRMAVSEKARLRVIRLGRKFPHAFVEGRVSTTRPPFGQKGRRFGYSPHHPSGRFHTLAGKKPVAVRSAVVAVFEVIDGRPLCWAYNAVTEPL